MKQHNAISYQIKFYNQDIISGCSKLSSEQSSENENFILQARFWFYLKTKFSSAVFFQHCDRVVIFLYI